VSYLSPTDPNLWRAILESLETSGWLRSEQISVSARPKLDVETPTKPGDRANKAMERWETVVSLACYSLLRKKLVDLDAGPTWRITTLGIHWLHHKGTSTIDPGPSPLERATAAVFSPQSGRSPAAAPQRAGVKGMTKGPRLRNAHADSLESPRDVMAEALAHQAPASSKIVQPDGRSGSPAAKRPTASGSQDQAAQTEPPMQAVASSGVKSRKWRWDAQTKSLAKVSDADATAPSRPPAPVSKSAPPDDRPLLSAEGTDMSSSTRRIAGTAFLPARVRTSPSVLAAVRAAARHAGGTQRSYIVRALVESEHPHIGVTDRYLLAVVAHELGLYLDAMRLIDGALISGLEGDFRFRAEQLREVCAVKAQVSGE
jgi:hypothetical protein